MHVIKGPQQLDLLSGGGWPCRGPLGRDACKGLLGSPLALGDAPPPRPHLGRLRLRAGPSRSN